MAKHANTPAPAPLKPNPKKRAHSDGDAGDDAPQPKRVRQPTVKKTPAATSTPDLTHPSMAAPVPQKSPSKKRARSDADTGDATPKPKRARKTDVKAAPVTQSTTSVKKEAPSKKKAAPRKAAATKKSGLPGLTPEPEVTPSINPSTPARTKAAQRVTPETTKSKKLSAPSSGLSRSQAFAVKPSSNEGTTQPTTPTSSNKSDTGRPIKKAISRKEPTAKEPTTKKAKGTTITDDTVSTAGRPQALGGFSRFDRPSAAIASFAAEQASSLQKKAATKKKAGSRQETGLPGLTSEAGVAPRRSPRKKALSPAIPEPEVALRRSPRKRTPSPAIPEPEVASRRSLRKRTPLPTLTPVPEVDPATDAASPEKKAGPRRSPRKKAGLMSLTPVPEVAPATNAASPKKTASRKPATRASPSKKNAFANLPTLPIPDVISIGIDAPIKKPLLKKSSLKKKNAKSDSPRKSVRFEVFAPTPPQKSSHRGYSSSNFSDSNTEDDESNYDAPRKSIYSDSEFDSDFSCPASWSGDENEDEEEAQKCDLPPAVEDPVTAVISPSIQIRLRSSKPKETGCVYFSLTDLLRNSQRIHLLVHIYGSIALDNAELLLPAWTDAATIMDYHLYTTSTPRAHLSHEQPHWGHHPARLMNLYLLAIFMQDPDCADAALSTLIRALRAADEVDTCVSTISAFIRRLDHLAHGADKFASADDACNHGSRVLAHAAPARAFFADLLTSAGAVASVKADIDAHDAGLPADDWHRTLLTAVRARIPSPDAKALRDDPTFLGPEGEWCDAYHFHSALNTSCAVLKGLRKAKGVEMSEGRETEREGTKVFWEERAARKKEKEMEKQRREREARLEMERRRFVEETTFTDSEESESEDERDDE